MAVGRAGCAAGYDFLDRHARRLSCTCLLEKPSAVPLFIALNLVRRKEDESEITYQVTVKYLIRAREEARWNRREPRAGEKHGATLPVLDEADVQSETPTDLWSTGSAQLEAKEF